MIPFEYIPKFWRAIDIGYENDCWNWLSSLNDKGYGKFYIGKKSILAHRLSFWIANGYIVDNLLVCHDCDNRACVNPNHLWQGIYKDNFLDAYKKGRLPFRGISNNKNDIKLTNEQIKYIKDKLKNGKRIDSALAKEFSVNSETIRHIRIGISWKELQARVKVSV